MASVIITKGQVDEKKVLFVDPKSTDKEQFRLGMLEFGQVLDAVYSGLSVNGSGEIEPIDRVKAFIKAVEDLINPKGRKPPEYFAYFIRKSGKPRKISSPELREVKKPNKDRYLVVFDFKNNAGEDKEFTIVAKPDRARRMHVSLPEKPDLASYLTVTVEEFKNINNDSKERMYLLANVLLSRCK